MTDPYHARDRVTLHHGDCLAALQTMPDNSVDAIVTDPPYGLSNTTPDKVADTIVRWASGDRDHVPEGRGFMGRPWDAFVPPPAVWDECLRVLKPGGHMLVFAGSRTQDLMGLSIRLAGFEIRDSLAWIYGSGFPKSMDVGKSIDRQRDDKGDARKVSAFLRDRVREAGMTAADLDGHLGGKHQANNYMRADLGRTPPWETWLRLREVVGFGGDMDAEVWRLNGRKGTPGDAWEKREVVGVQKGAMSGWDMDGGTKFVDRNITTSHSDAARRWEGFGTALKPAQEPIILARRPLEGTVAANVLAHGVGALNIDGCRVPSAAPVQVRGTAGMGYGGSKESYERGEGRLFRNDGKGRFPANVLLDEHAAQEVDKQSGVLKSPAPYSGERHKGTSMFGVGGVNHANEYGDSGGASRFFPVFKYQAKAPKRERPVIEREDGTRVSHPTVKPLALMSWLVTLITPTGGVVLDPFAGSGTTLEAARDKGFQAVGVEADAEHCELIVARLEKGDEGLFAA